MLVVNLTHGGNIVQLACPVIRKCADVVKAERITFRNWMARCKADSPVLVQNLLLLTLVELAFQGYCHKRALYEPFTGKAGFPTA